VDNSSGKSSPPTEGFDTSKRGWKNTLGIRSPTPKSLRKATLMRLDARPARLLSALSKQLRMSKTDVLNDILHIVAEEYERAGY